MLPRNCSGSLYDILKVKSDATTREVKKAYHQLALTLHPDKTGGQTTEEFKRISEAQAILTDPKLRQTYDNFGKKGLDMMNQYDVLNRIPSIGVLRLCLLFFTLYAALILLTLVLVIVRQDYGKTWPWAAVFTPLWISFLPLLLVSCALIYQSTKQCRIGMLFVACEFILIIVAAATAVAGLDGRIELVVSFAPFVVLLAVETLRAAWLFIPSQFSIYVLGREDMESVCGSGLYWGFVLETLFQKSCVFVFLGLGMHRARQTSEKESELFSFWLVFSPLIVYFGVMSIISSGVAFFAKHSGTHETPSLLRRIGRSVFAALSYGSFLYMSCMLAAKCNVELNGALSGFHPSLAVALIPMQVVLSFLVFIPCCASCFATKLKQAFNSEEDNLGGGFSNVRDYSGEEGKASGSSRVIIPEDNPIRGEYQEIRRI